MMNKLIYGVVVTYHPDACVIENIRAMLGQISHLVIVDNESSFESKDLLAQFSSNSAVSVIYNSFNEGVAKAFNQGLRLAYDAGADYFILFDQDSRPQPEMVQSLVNTYQSLQQPLVFLGPILLDRATGRADILTQSLEPLSVQLIISSGCFFARAVIDQIGLMDEDLFIDYVDHDYCLRLRASNGSVWRVPSAKMLHSFGDACEKEVLGRRFFIQNYSPKRRYYMARNRVLIYKRYAKTDAGWFKNDMVFLCKDLIKLLFFEEKRVSKGMAFVRGFFDGLRG